MPQIGLGFSILNLVFKNWYIRRWIYNCERREVILNQVQDSSLHSE